MLLVPNDIRVLIFLAVLDDLYKRGFSRLDQTEREHIRMLL